MKRFYKKVEMEPSGQSEGYQILLDSKPIKTPSKNVLIVPNKELALKIVQEWESVEEEVEAHELPMTQLLYTALDYVFDRRDTIESEIIKYLSTDLVAFHTEDPIELSEKQKKDWGGVLKWFETQTSIHLPITNDFTPVNLSEKDFEKAERIMRQYDLFSFTVFQATVALTGSFVLATAFMKQEYSPEEIYELANLEEEFYLIFYDLKKHGSDPMQKKKMDEMKRDLNHLRCFHQFF